MRALLGWILCICVGLALMVLAGCNRLGAAAQGDQVPLQEDTTKAEQTGGAIGGIVGGLAGGPAGAAAGTAIGQIVGGGVITLLGLFGLIRHGHASAATAKLDTQPKIDAAFDEGVTRAAAGSVGQAGVGVGGSVGGGPGPAAGA